MSAIYRDHYNSSVSTTEAESETAYKIEGRVAYAVHVVAQMREKVLN